MAPAAAVVTAARGSCARTRCWTSSRPCSSLVRSCGARISAGRRRARAGTRVGSRRPRPSVGPRSGPLERARVRRGRRRHPFVLRARCRRSVVAVEGHVGARRRDRQRDRRQDLAHRDAIGRRDADLRMPVQRCGTWRTLPSRRCRASAGTCSPRAGVIRSAVRRRGRSRTGRLRTGRGGTPGRPTGTSPTATTSTRSVIRVVPGRRRRGRDGRRRRRGGRRRRRPRARRRVCVGVRVRVRVGVAGAGVGVGAAGAAGRRRRLEREALSGPSRRRDPIPSSRRPGPGPSSTSRTVIVYSRLVIALQKIQ